MPCGTGWDEAPLLVGRQSSQTELFQHALQQLAFKCTHFLHCGQRVIPLQTHNTMPAPILAPSKSLLFVIKCASLLCYMHMLILQTALVPIQLFMQVCPILTFVCKLHKTKYVLPGFFPGPYGGIAKHMTCARKRMLTPSQLVCFPVKHHFLNYCVHF